MGFLSVIRRWALRGKMAIREISRRIGQSRNTIRKYLRADIVEPGFQAPKRPRKLHTYKGKLPVWLLKVPQIAQRPANRRADASGPGEAGI